MREIKCRAWDKKRKLYLKTDLLFLIPNCSMYNPKDRTIELVNGLQNPFKKSDIKNELEMDIIWQQYTGLKDKNGVEIYEGDIVGEEGVYQFIDRGWEPESEFWKIIGEKKANFTGKKEEKYIAGYRPYIVEWRELSCGFEPFSDSNNNCGHCGGGLVPSSVEVIGNIFENLDLLNNK